MKNKQTNKQTNKNSRVTCSKKSPHMISSKRQMRFDNAQVNILRTLLPPLLTSQSHPSSEDEIRRWYKGLKGRKQARVHGKHVQLWTYNEPCNNTSYHLLL